MLLKSTGSEGRWSGFKTVALSLLEGLLWESYLTVLCLNFVVSFTCMVIYPTSRVIMKTGKDSVCETLRRVPCNDQCPFHVSCVCVCVCVRMCVCAHSVVQSCPTHCGPKDCSPPGSSVHGIFQARILQWGVISYSRGSSPPTDQIRVSFVSCIGRWILYH